MGQVIPLKPLLDAARLHKFAFGAFNVNSPNHAKAAIEIHDIYRSACILQGSEGANGFMGGNPDFRKATIEEKRLGARRIAAAVKEYAEATDIPVVLHLDHGKDYDSCLAAMDGGYTSIMIDGSHLPLKENIELTRNVVEEAHLRGISVEGELGILRGVEDEVVGLKDVYTHPKDALTFIIETGVDALAISYGTQHGANKRKNVQIRKEIAIATNELLLHEGVDCALVSHGSSSVPYDVVETINQLGGDLKDTAGIPVEQIQEVIPYGIAKINVDTDIRLVITRNIRGYFKQRPDAKDDEVLCSIWKKLQEGPTEFDPRSYMVPAQHFMISGKMPTMHFRNLMSLVEQGVKEIVGERIVQFGSVRSMYGVEPKTLEEMAQFYRERE